MDRFSIVPVLCQLFLNCLGELSALMIVAMVSEEYGSLLRSFCALVLAMSFALGMALFTL